MQTDGLFFPPYGRFGELITPEAVQNVKHGVREPVTRWVKRPRRPPADDLGVWEAMVMTLSTVLKAAQKHV